jgi:septal ring factor EnvC (AmiA/AmiB activator)
MLLSKTRLDDIDICLMPHCDIREITVNELTKLTGHQEPVLLLTARSNSEYLVIRDLEELTFRQQTGLNVDISVLNNIKQDNERLRDENHQQHERIIELEKQITDLITIRDEMKHLCKQYKNDIKKTLDKNDEFYQKFEGLDEKLNKQLFNEENLLISTRLKSE